MKRVAILFALALPAFCQQFSTANNYAVDLSGNPDSRTSTYGTADSNQFIIHFNAPAGYETHITRVYGDFIAAPRQGEFPSGSMVEVGWGLKSTAPDGSQYVVYPQSSGTGYMASGYDNSFVWRQGIMNAGRTAYSAEFDFPNLNFTLHDNTLISQAFVALNTSGLTIHEEPTFVIVYEFVPIGSLQIGPSIACPNPSCLTTRPTIKR